MRKVGDSRIEIDPPFVYRRAAPLAAPIMPNVTINAGSLRFATKTPLIPPRITEQRTDTRIAAAIAATEFELSPNATSV